MRSVLIKKITTNASQNGWGYYLTANKADEDSEKGIFIKLNQNILKFQLPAYLDIGYRKHMQARRIIISSTIIFGILLIVLFLIFLVTSFN